MTMSLRESGAQLGLLGWICLAEIFGLCYEIPNVEFMTSGYHESSSLRRLLYHASYHPVVGWWGMRREVDGLVSVAAPPLSPGRQCERNVECGPRGPKTWFPRFSVTLMWGYFRDAAHARSSYYLVSQPRSSRARALEPAQRCFAR